MNPSKLISKFTRVAVEGQTTDGREITREQIVEMATNYDPEVYGARIWLEHFRGIFADGAFPAYGDVAALKAEEISEGSLKGKMGLYAQLAPTPDLVKINEKNQKIYTSIEMDTDFSGSGQAGFVGLAVTDSPASLGTQALKFSSEHKEAAELLNARKQKADNLFSSAEELTIEMAKEPAPKNKDKVGDSSTGLFSRVKDLLGKNKKDQDEKFSEQFKDQDDAIMAVAEEVQELTTQLQPLTKFADNLTDLFGKEGYESLKQQVEEFSSGLADLKEKLGTEEFGAQRPPASGGGDKILADC